MPGPRERPMAGNTRGLTPAIGPPSAPSHPRPARQHTPGQPDDRPSPMSEAEAQDSFRRGPHRHPPGTLGCASCCRRAAWPCRAAAGGAIPAGPARASGCPGRVTRTGAGPAVGYGADRLGMGPCSRPRPCGISARRLVCPVGCRPGLNNAAWAHNPEVAGSNPAPATRGHRQNCRSHTDRTLAVICSLG